MGYRFHPDVGARATSRPTGRPSTRGVASYVAPGAHMKTALSLLLLAMLTACTTTMRARSDHDPRNDFSQYKSFACIAEDPLITPQDSGVQVSPLNRRRIVEAIESQ